MIFFYFFYFLSVERYFLFFIILLADVSKLAEKSGGAPKEKEILQERERKREALNEMKQVLIVIAHVKPVSSRGQCQAPCLLFT